MIILEGADNSGKSTLARSLGLPIFTAGPAPKTETELVECMRDQRGRSTMPCVQDRLTCISQLIYSEDMNKQFLRDELKHVISIPGVIVVYCRPPERVLMDMSTHKVKSYDTEENLSKIVSNQHTYIERYDTLMAGIPHVPYDWTDPTLSTSSVVEMLVNTQYNQVSWSDMYSRMSIVTRMFGTEAFQ